MLSLCRKTPDKTTRANTVVLSGGAVYARPPTRGLHDILSGAAYTDYSILR